MHQAAWRSFRTGLGASAGPSRRATRVVALLAAIVALSAGDLYMTLEHLRSFGMLEANPVARQLMAQGSPALLVLWKVVTVGFAVGVLYAVRRRAVAEVGAVICCVILSWLMVRWASYSEQMSKLTSELRAAQIEDEPRWVSMAPGG